MRALLIATAVAVAVVATGCAHTGGSPKTEAPTVDPVCAFAGTKARTCVVRGDKAVCNIYVGEVEGRTHVYPYTLSVPRDADKVVVVWHLQVPGARFVKRSDVEDGPKWKGSSGSEFEDGEPTEDADGAQQGRPEGRRYRIKFKNGANGAGPHAYVIQYRKGSEVKRCDPFIVSEGN